MGVYAFFVSSGVGRSGPTPNRRRLVCARAGRKNLAADRLAVANPTVRSNFRRLLRGDLIPSSIAEGCACRANEHDQFCAADVMPARLRAPALSENLWRVSLRRIRAPFVQWPSSSRSVARRNAQRRR